MQDDWPEDGVPQYLTCRSSACLLLSDSVGSLDVLQYCCSAAVILSYGVLLHTAADTRAAVPLDAVTASGRIRPKSPST
jgi:hypothetical protein